MATVVPFASCYAISSARPLQFFGGADGGYFSLFAYHGPRGVPRPRMTYRGPKMTLRQICRMLRILRQVHAREAAMARKATTPLPAPVSPDKRCLAACFRRRRSANIKRAG